MPTNEEVQHPSGADQKGRRFRLARKVKPQAPPAPPATDPETREQKEMRDLAAMGDEADRGTPEQDASLRAGCTSFLRVVGLFFLLMFGSIIVTFFWK